MVDLEAFFQTEACLPVWAPAYAVFQIFCLAHTGFVVWPFARSGNLLQEECSIKLFGGILLEGWLYTGHATEVPCNCMRLLMNVILKLKWSSFLLPVVALKVPLCCGWQLLSVFWRILCSACSLSCVPVDRATKFNLSCWYCNQRPPWAPLFVSHSLKLYLSSIVVGSNKCHPLFGPPSNDCNIRWMFPNFFLGGLSVFVLTREGIFSCLNGRMRS